jgi:tetratricopeptide (TPR) repeat protein
VPDDNDQTYPDSQDSPAELSPQAMSGEDADSLYAQGMAHYRRREWQEAKDCFLRLKSVAPDRRGVDALLNEVDLFLQLAAMQPERQQEEQAPQEEVEEARSEEPPQPTSAIPTVRRRSPGSAILVILALLMIVFATLYATGMLDSLVGNQRQARVQILVNQGRAALNVGDYDRAVQAFGEALALAPTNEEVKTWYAKAQRYQQLTSWYEQADEDIAAQRWDDALATLDRIMAVEPTYKDTSTKVEFVKSQQTLDARFAEAKSYLEQGKWDEVIKILEPLREQAASFNPDEVQQTLFYAYFRQGVEWLAGAGASPDTSLDLLGQAIQSFDRALALFPTDKTALEERRLADLYRQGHLFVNQKNWPQAVLVLQQIQSARADYMGGQATAMLCASYLQLGDAYYASGSLAQALEQYRNVLAVEGCDHVDAALKEREVYVILYPPTPTPTSTRTPTRTPRPVPTRTPTPTAPPTAPPPATQQPAPTPTTKPR